MSPAEKLARALAARPVKNTRGWLVCCPVHKDDTPSLYLTDEKDGRVRWHCFAGCSQGALFDHFRSHGLLGDRPQLKPYISRKAAPDPIIPDDAALGIWGQATVAAGTRVQNYLTARGITLPLPSSLRYEVAAHYHERLILPAMVAGVQASDGRVVGVQQTFLNPQKSEKASVAVKRRTTGRLYDGAVRLGEAAPVMGIGEGVETALSAMQLFGIPTWACLGASRMSSVKIPRICRELHIFADADEAGERAIQRTAEANKHLKIIAHLPRNGGDWNDALKTTAA